MTKDALYEYFAVFLASLILGIVLGALVDLWRLRRARLARKAVPVESLGRDA